MPVVLVSGAASGLGATFAKSYASKPDHQVIAVDFQACSFPSHLNVKAFTVDVTSELSIQSLASQIKNEPIDLFIHSAGIRGLVPQIEDVKPDDVAACETLEVMDQATLLRTFSTNATGTFMLIRAVLPNLRLAKAPKVVVMSSRMGSIGNNQTGRRSAGAAYAYRASKAALNQIVRSFAVDVPEITFVLCHPGRVETNLVRCKEEGAIPAEESVGVLLPLIERWSQSDSGKFYDRFGERIEW